MYERMRRLVAALTSGLYEREEAVRLGLLASMAGESMFMLGPPGVGKSLIARRLQMVFTGARNFSYLMGRFSTPDEVFGPLSIRKLRQEDRYERVTTNYLPEADVVFLDEIWKASAPIRNALLTALNERLYRNGSEEMVLPLKVFIGASNELPDDDETAAAFWDRFLIRLVVGPIQDANAFMQLINDTTDVYADVVDQADKITQAEYTMFQERLAAVTIPAAVGELLLEIRENLQSGSTPDSEEAPRGRYVSDRRWKKVVHLLRASALLHGRSEVEALDCALVRHCVWDTLADRPAADRIVSECLSRHAGHPQLVESLGRRLSGLRERVLSALTEVVDEARILPVFHREEYYRLLGHGDETVTVLVWHGDVDDLDGETEADVDLFSYDLNDQLVGSRTATVKRVAPWMLEVDGIELRIETEHRTTTTTRSRSMSGEERALLLQEVDAIMGDIRGAVDVIVSERDAVDDDARQHLFVPAANLKTVTQAMERAAEELVKTRIAAEELRSELSDS